jgi:ankyrin repeat protein
VDCQVIHICDCIPARIPQALAELPETLDETYERSLRGINKANWEFAHRMFQFVSVASRPLYVKELADLLAFDFKAGSIPKFHKDWRLEDPADAVLSTCSTLLAIVDDYDGFSVVQFSHFSVKEFLTSTRLAESTDIISRRYHVSTTAAHTLVAQACLGILLHLDQDITSNSLENFPLAEYAAEHWVDHARFEDVSRNVEDGMKQLFDPSNPHLAICVWIYDPAIPTWGRMTRNETPLPLPRTSLHYAAFWGFHSVVEFLIIENSQDVCSRDSTDNATPLHLASRNGHVKAACKLIERGADARAQDNKGETPFHLVLKNGQVDFARMLIEHGADLSAQNNEGETPLHLALEMGQVVVARMLIERGADPIAQNRRGETPLHFASRAGQVDVARMLIEHGANATAQNNYGSTPLQFASQMGQVDVAHMLIERGADATAQNNYGSTPLHLASERGHVDVARILIQRGADATAQNRRGETPLHLASQWRLVDIARMLIERGADATARNRRGETPLHLALQMGQVDVARMLIERGADLTAQINDGWTPLHLASQRGQVDVACMLIEHGADLTAQINDGWTPLHLASASPLLSRVSPQKYAEVAHTLLEHGADVNARNKDGLTPFVLASQIRLTEIIHVLVQHGADSGAHDNANRIEFHSGMREQQMPAPEPFIQPPLHSRPLPLPAFSPNGPMTFSKAGFRNADDLWHTNERMY